MTNSPDALATALEALDALKRERDEQMRLGIRAECDLAMWKKSAEGKQRYINQLEAELAALRAQPALEPQEWKLSNTRGGYVSSGVRHSCDDWRSEGFMCADCHAVLDAALRASRGPQGDDPMDRLAHLCCRKSGPENTLMRQMCLLEKDHPGPCGFEARGPQEATAQAWQPMETRSPLDEVFWLVVPKTAEETYTDTSGRPITSGAEPRTYYGPYGCWSSLCKAIGWYDPKVPPLPAPPVAASGAEGAGR